MAGEAGLSPAELEEMLLSEETTADQLSAVKNRWIGLLKKEPRQPAGECSTPPADSIIEQLNVSDFDNVEYQLGFDPVAAGEEALRAKLACGQWSAMQMKAYLDLKHLKKRGGVTEFCLELERLSREPTPDASEEELSPHKGR
ncbi:hypothetical protein COOONC_17645 [Cooperia oncophora]